MGDVKWVGNINGSMNAPTLLFTNSSAGALEEGDICFFTSGELTKGTNDLLTVAVVCIEDALASATNVPCIPIAGGNIFRADYVSGDSGCLPGVICGIAVTAGKFEIESDGTNKTVLCIATDTDAGTADFIAEPTTTWA